MIGRDDNVNDHQSQMVGFLKMKKSALTPQRIRHIQEAQLGSTVAHTHVVVKDEFADQMRVLARESTRGGETTGRLLGTLTDLEEHGDMYLQALVGSGQAIKVNKQIKDVSFFCIRLDGVAMSMLLEKCCKSFTASKLCSNVPKCDARDCAFIGNELANG